MQGIIGPAALPFEGSKHEPVGAHLVPELVEDMCDYVNDHWDESTPIHLAAYLMWRLNWIHPFADGNGRTSRIISYWCSQFAQERCCRARQQFQIRSLIIEFLTSKRSMRPTPRIVTEESMFRGWKLC